MSRPKALKAWGKDVPVEDPGLTRDVFRLLRETQGEFPIKVEGTSTLPYTCFVKDLDFEKGLAVFKLVRPLPHELMEGAEFRATLALEEQRYEALMQFAGRDGYLAYKFNLPTHLFQADRRQEKRYPFRPRESAYVMAQDGGIPGYGVAGPLLNISQGGLAMRVDRVLKLDDGMRIPAAQAPLERGHSFSRIRIQDLPRLPLLEVQGHISHYSEAGGGGMLLGFSFARLQDSQISSLRDCLTLREQLQRKSPGGIREALQALPRAGAPVREGGRSSAPIVEEKSHEFSTRAPLPGTDPLDQLARRSVRLALAVADVATRARLVPMLHAQGFHRLEVSGNLAELGRLWEQSEPPAALLVDLGLVAGADTGTAVRLIERQVQGLGDISLVLFASENEDGGFLGSGSRTRLLSLDVPPGDAREAWGSAIAYAAGLLE